MGTKLFNDIYHMLEIEIEDGTDPNERQKLVHDVCEGNQNLINLCQKLEEIIFWEQNFTYAWT